MSRFDTGTDDARVRVRATKGSRPRTKRRPDYSGRPLGRIVAIDRGRFTVALEDGTRVYAVKAREIPRGAVVIGDLVRLTGDLTGREDTLARVVQVEERTNVLRRSLEEADDGRAEKVIVANIDLMVIVTASSNPTPRAGMVERTLVAAQEAGIPALLCMTKTDLADPADFIAQFNGFDLETVTVDSVTGDGVEAVAERLTGLFSVLIGHSGVGKSTLINALIPGINRAVGELNLATGKGRHTSTSSVALELPEGGWLVDTPGVRSFGLAHTEVEDVLAVFPDLAVVTEFCLPNCTHVDTEVSCALDEWASQQGPFAEGGEAPEMTVAAGRRSELVGRARALINGLQQTGW
ncbi:ribosome small subunit-dependent GTPase A [Actinomyces minihominis]|uniref:ribosome small subunit-dependent GTPase A n=1 Tax=Actinomyces minihominis TaxID=2002838 RepID=UPI000C078133|nr:ribosome small subunit-dependent GTPase A [Actinomyces minihominis]